MTMTQTTNEVFASVVEALADDCMTEALNVIANTVQKTLGATDGGVAGMILTCDHRIDAFKALIVEYIHAETRNLAN
jgi:hypothetical protein